jgi:hypothetical protein
LRGLPALDVARQLSALVRRQVPEREAARVHARTGGNQFFVGEVGASSSTTEPAPARCPRACARRSVRGWPACGRDGQAPRAAAIVGREFRAAMVAAMVDAAVLACLAALDEAASCSVYARPDDRRDKPSGTSV